MGFAALDGLMIGTRAGALDAGVQLYMMQRTCHIHSVAGQRRQSAPVDPTENYVRQ